MGILRLFLKTSVLELEGRDLSQDTQIEIREAAEEFAAILNVATEKTRKATTAAYNYFEFTWPMSQRLTDEAWVELLSTDPPKPPKWTNIFAA